MDRREAIKRTALISGLAVSHSLIAAMMQGCKVDKAPDWTPSYLTPEEAEQVAAMAETILPKTDTQGAKDVFVDRYIDLVAQDCLEPEEQAKFKESLAEANAAAMKAHSKNFAACTPEEQLALLTTIDQAAKQKVEDNKLLPPPADEVEAMARNPAFLQFKQMVFAGFFSSEEIGKNVLAYDPIPGEYIACGDLQTLTGGKVWTL